MKKCLSILKNKNITNIAIGKFESMHLAHLRVLSHLDKNGAILLIKKPTESFLLSINERQKFSKYPIYIIEFKKIKYLSGKKFIKLLQKTFPNLKTIIVGQDFRFGKGRKSGIKDIAQFGLNVISVPEIFLDGIAVHSSTIRDYLMNGQIELANKLLGRNYSIKGKVVKGLGLGAKELVPTINIKPKQYILPQNGVYAGFARVGKKIYRSIIFLGNRLSIDSSFSVECHILGSFSAQVEPKVEIFFVKKMRDNQKFSSLLELKKQIKLDIKAAKIALESNKKKSDE